MEINSCNNIYNKEAKNKEKQAFIILNSNLVNIC